eukprot:7066896-Prymnesium_polylepis.1
MHRCAVATLKGPKRCPFITPPLLRYPSVWHPPGLKRGCFAWWLFRVDLSDFAFWEGSASERRQPSRGSPNQIIAGESASSRIVRPFSEAVRFPKC